MSGIDPKLMLTKSEAAELTPEQRLQQQRQSLTSSLNQLNLALEESERATESLRNLKNEKARELDALYIAQNEELANLVAAKLPSLNRGVKCYINPETQQISIYLLSCFPENTTAVNDFFCTFLNDPDFEVRANTGGVGRTVSFNQPVITVLIPLADHEKLVTGLKLANAAPRIRSTTMTAKC